MYFRTTILESRYRPSGAGRLSGGVNIHAHWRGQQAGDGEVGSTSTGGHVSLAAAQHFALDPAALHFGYPLSV